MLVSDTPHYENIDFDIPSSWIITTLSEVFFMHAGKSISAADISAEPNEKYRYLCVGGNGVRGYVSSYNTDGAHPIIGRQGALCGNINYAEDLFYATEHAVVVDTFCETETWWAYYFLIQLNLNQYATATAQPGLSVNTIGDVQIPLPPLEEQKRIVAAIEQWFSLIDTLETAKEDLQMCIAQTKSKILDLAIHGKLVPQDPNDEPAIELLKCINPKFTPCDNAQYMYDLPNNWEWTNLGNIGNWQSGGTPDRKNKLYYNGEIPWLKIADLQDNYVTEATEFISEEGLNNSSAKINPTGSVALAMYGSIGKVGILTFPSTTNQAICVCSDYIVDQKYLFYYLISQRESFFMQSGGGVQANISKQIIVKQPIPTPPLNEQRRIVAKIEELFTILDEIQKSIEA